MRRRTSCRFLYQVPRLLNPARRTSPRPLQIHTGLHEQAALTVKDGPAATMTIQMRADRSAVLSLIVLALVLIGYNARCARHSSPGNQLETILQSAPGCNAPCWRGITPGSSTEGDFLTVVDAASPPEFYNLRRSASPRGAGYVWQNRTLNLASALLIRNEKVTSISFQPENELTLDSIFQFLNAPNAYTAHISPGEAFLFDSYLFYEQEGVVVNVRIVPFNTPVSALKPVCEVSLTADVAARAIYLLQPGAVTKMIEVLSGVMAVPGESRPWTGLGTIKLTSCPN